MSLVRYATRWIALHLPKDWFFRIVWAIVRFRHLRGVPVHSKGGRVVSGGPSLTDHASARRQGPRSLLGHEDSPLTSRLAHFRNQSHLRVVVSPHLDDAALSCGGWIAGCTRGDLDITVVTVFAGDGSPDTPLADLARRRWAPFEVGPAVRRAEDMSAMRMLGAQCLQLSFPEAAYRIEPGGSPFPSTDHLFRQADREHWLIRPVADALAESVAPDRGIILALPLALGNHIDHWISRLAGEYLAKSGFPCELSYYEDLPYAMGLEVHQIVGPDWQPLPVPLAPEDVAAKLRAIGCYATQVRTGGGIRTIIELESYARKLGNGTPVERLWFNQ